MKNYVLGNQMNSQNVLGPKILNHDTFDFKNSTIIHPGTSTELDKDRSVIKKVTMFTIDSRDRDIDKYPTPSKYVIDLDDDIPDVISAELVNANVPFKTYLVNKNNNQFSMEINGQQSNIVIDFGDYSPLQLATLLTTTIISSIPLSFDFKVEYDEATDNFVFYSDLSFRLIFDKKNKQRDPFNFGKVLGFNLKSYSSKFDGSPKYSSLPYLVKSEFRKNFDDKSYVLLKITGFNVHHSLSQIIDKTFAIIPEKQTSQNVSSNVYIPFKNFNPPIAKMTRLQISFVDHNGDLVDFQNHDHYFTIKFDSFKHTRKYATFLDIP